jgi:hypothetical protein
MIARTSGSAGSISVLAVMLTPRPKCYDQKSSISLERLMERRNVDFRRSVWLLQANPISTIVSPRLINDCRPVVKLESDPVIVKPVAPDFANAFHGAQKFEQRAKSEPGARNLKASQRTV